MKMFADDTKIYKVVKSFIQECISLQEDLDALSSWASTWQMCFHPDKCVVMRFGKNPPDYEYTMKDVHSVRHPLRFVEEEKDLGVVVDNQLTFSKQVIQQTAKANKILALIRRSFHYLPMEMLVKMYKSLVRPYLDYAISVWHPITKAKADELEKVQRRATKMIRGLKDLEYEERLEKLKLHSLVYRRLRGDLIIVYKYKTGMIKCSDVDSLFPPSRSSNLRGHSFKVRKERSQHKVRFNFFSQRVVNWWNDLPPSG